MQKLVGGYIEVVPVGPGIDMIIDREGTLLELPHNGCGVRRAYSFARADDEGDFVSLTKEDITRCLKLWSAHRHVPRPNPDACITIIKGDEIITHLRAMAESAR